VHLWEHTRAELVPFLAFDPEIRRMICPTNAIESINARIHRAVKATATPPPGKPRSNASTWPS